MNGKRLLDRMELIDMEYVEAAAYPERKRTFRWRGWSAAAACLLLTAAIGGATAYATGAFDTVKAYFTGENAKAQLLVSDGEQTAMDGPLEIHLENVVADEQACWFTVSFAGLSEPVTAGSDFEMVWITKDGKEIREFSNSVGAYVDNIKKGYGDSAEAISLYEDSDAAVLVGCYVPYGMAMSELKEIVFTYEGLSLRINANGYIASSYELKTKDGVGEITAFTASAIGFSFTAPSSTIFFDIALIRSDGTYCEDSDQDFIGYEIRHGSSDAERAQQVTGNWSGRNAVSLGILDIDQYSGIRVNGVDYFFVKE